MGGRVRGLLGTITALSALGLSALGVVTAGAAQAAPELVDLPISFEVANTNTSGVSCSVDGKPYVVRGHLTGPASALSGDARPDGTLYLHGLELGEWFWRMPVVGDGYTREMAGKGHVSVTIDRLGYNASGHPGGMQSCVGGQADIAHQIVQHLRAGSYTGSIHPRFGKVALVGHSLGGAIAQVEAYSYGDVDAVGVLSYADLAFSPSVVLTSATWGPKCLLGGTRSEAGQAGYAHLTRNDADYRKNFLANTPAAALPEATAQHDLNPCGDLLSAVPAAAVNGLRIAQIDVPVLVMAGDRDLVFDVERVKLQSHLYLGSPDTTLRVVKGATHGITLEPTAARFVDEIDAWLRRSGI